MKLEVLIAQIIFGGIGLFFIGIAAVGVFSGEHYTGWQPVVGVFIGLPFIAVVTLLDGQHKKNKAQKIQQTLIDAEPNSELPPPPSNTCPTCHHQLSFIEQYKAWYCFSCKEYK